MTKATAKHPAAILAVRRFVEASIKTIPQNDEPRSVEAKERILIPSYCYIINDYIL